MEATPLCHNLPLNVGGDYDWLLANRIEERWWDVTFVIWLLKIVASLLLEDSLDCLLGFHVWWNKLPCWKSPHGKKLRAASGQQPTRNRGSQSRLQGLEFWPQPCDLTSDSFLSRALGWDPRCGLLRDSEAEDSAKPCQDSWPHRYCEVTNMCDFKLLNCW